MMLVVLTSVAIGLACTSPLVVEDLTWPGFRGEGTSVAAVKQLPLTWSVEKGVLWRKPVDGQGQSSPLIHGNRVFVTSAIGEQKEKAAITCVDLNTGKQVWQHTHPSAHPAKVTGYISFAAPTPIVDDRAVYAFFETGRFVAVDHEGNQLWNRDITQVYGTFKGNHGLGGSPVAGKDGIYLLVDHDGPSYLLKINKKTGETIWKQDRPKRVSWSSPVVVPTAEGERIVISSNGVCQELDGKTGKLIWEVTGIEGNTVPSATVHDQLVVVGSSTVGQNVAIRRGGTGDVSESHVAWTSSDATATFSSPLVYRGHVYMVSRTGVAFCVELESGKTLWKQRIKDSCWASPVGVLDRVYFFGTEGNTDVMAAGPEAKVLAENALPTDDIVYGVAIAEGRIVIRTGKELICVGSPAN